MSKGYILGNNDGNVPSGTTPHGSCYISTPAATTVTNAGTYYLLAGTTTGISQSNFTHSSPGRLTYTGTVTGTFYVTANMSFVSSANNLTITSSIAKNGTPIASSEMPFFKTASTDVKQVTCFAVVDLAQNDYIEIYITDDSAASTVTANAATLMINSI